jgi:peptide/nickel transport system substrate-binding protein
MSWKEGKVLMPPDSWLVTFPQMLDPNPAVVANRDFRRALLYGTDREQIVEAIQSGLTPVADAMFHPTRPFYKDIEGGVVRYSYDPARAGQMLQGLGYQKGSDGMLRDPSGQRLEVELRAVETDINRKGIFTLSDSWQRLGVGAEAFVIPRARARDPEYRATFPAFEFTRQPTDPSDLKRYHGNQARLPSNNFTGSNYMRYMNAEWDGLLDRFFVTIPTAERMAVLREIVRYMSDNVLPLPIGRSWWGTGSAT